MHSRAPESIIESFIQQKNSNFVTSLDVLALEVKKVIEILKRDNPERFEASPPNRMRVNLSSLLNLIF